MSNELPQIRANLSRVPTSLKQGNLVFAAQAMRKGVHALQSKNLMRNEVDELRRLILQGSGYLIDSVEIKSIFPLALDFIKGEEANYLSTLDELIECLQSEASKDIIIQAEETSRKKTSGLEKGRTEVSEGRYDSARSTFSNLKKDFSKDATLINDIAQIFMDANMNEDAAAYLHEALAVSPENIHSLNKLAVTLRKLKLYDESEKKFIKALSIDDHDPYLYFNFGRLYLDWQKFDKGLVLAQKACEILPTFTEAQKMANYLKKQISAQSS